jgi:hypothetical protein
MKYFQHPSNFRNTAELKAVTRVGGVAGFGIAVMLLEVLAEYRTDKAAPFALALEDKRYGYDFWQAELFLASKSAVVWWLKILADAGVIDADELYDNRTVSAPMLQGFLDESARREASKKSR